MDGRRDGRRGWRRALARLFHGAPAHTPQVGPRPGRRVRRHPLSPSNAGPFSVNSTESELAIGASFGVTDDLEVRATVLPPRPVSRLSVRITRGWSDLSLSQGAGRDRSGGRRLLPLRRQTPSRSTPAFPFSRTSVRRCASTRARSSPSSEATASRRRRGRRQFRLAWPSIHHLENIHVGGNTGVSMRLSSPGPGETFSVPFGGCLRAATPCGSARGTDPRYRSVLPVAHAFRPRGHPPGVQTPCKGATFQAGLEVRGFLYLCRLPCFVAVTCRRRHPAKEQFPRVGSSCARRRRRSARAGRTRLPRPPSAIPSSHRAIRSTPQWPPPAPS